MSDTVTTRTRFVSFTRADLDAYGDVLSAAFPNVRFRTGFSEAQRRSAEPPAIVLHQRLADCVANQWGDMTLTILLGDLDGLETPRNLPPMTSWYEPVSMPRANLYFRHPNTGSMRLRDQALPPFVEALQFDFYARRDDAAGVKAIDKAVRLLRKVGWSGLVEFYLLHLSADAPPRIELKHPAIRTSIILGRDAVRWAREDPERLIGVLTGNPLANGCRPLADKTS
jgi:hypothetical protein